MLDSLKQTGKNIGRKLSRTWEILPEGWRELDGVNSRTIPVSWQS